MAKNNLRWIDVLTTWLVAVGGINWGLDVLGLNLVDGIARALNSPMVGTIIYSAVGISGAWFGARFLMGKIKAQK